MTTLRANDWVRQAALQPVAFAQVREDPAIDLALLEGLGAELRVVMIASGGCTAASLVAGGRVGSLQLIDLNPAQIALVRVKLSLLEHAGPEERMQLMGHSWQSPTERRRDGLRLLDNLQLAHECLGEVEVWSRVGMDHCGRYELLFAELRHHLARDLSASLPEAFRAVMSQDNLQALFGAAATANRATDFWRHFYLQTMQELDRDPQMQGPFLSQMLRGRFGPRTHHWLALSPPPSWPTVSWKVSPVLDALRDLPARSCDFLHLSNTLDWVSEEEARFTLDQAARVLRPGGVVVLRQLNSTLPIRRLGGEITWDDALSQRLLAGDSSFFYRELHVGMRP